ncbi:1-deoxy-D-xylulose-5-phosphate reductoisomerase [Sphingomonas piscis]|uniref:1-deoxy-D-xylulose 5-phosphate reductoisomerase n=1 Tax=Sphingomonas piscis TaxID=2714943 RepID=A0A6G7YLF0_9SPHN|nr:1-deoxy-D-xylulose-5-phosphate reductoisomerase [Sphingomonas piscis]QIK77569.1 1-deoxy-D-xylulose-5-phosphate reductoisomerase [Sphingomonas piscis]
MTRRISILGATGSIGSSTLDLIERNPDRFEVAAVTANSNVDELAAIARRTGATLAVIADETKYSALKEAVAGTRCAVAAGENALIEAAQAEAELVIAAIVGCAGLRPTMAAIEAGRTVGLANKEALVTAGSLMTETARRKSVDLLPVDSEHNAIFQCLAGESTDQIERMILTASGGPFRTWTAERIDAATPDQAVAHPNWSMGAKISVDSATLMNKGLELIEAHHLFGVSADRLDVVVHPQSAIHSLVEFVDGSMLAQIGPPDMRVPIAYVLGWPERIATPVPRVRLADLGRMDFEEPDLQRFPALRIAREALAAGGAAAVVLNAANEVAVELFLANRIKFNDIPAIVEQALNRHSGPSPASIEDVMEIDRGSRADARLVAGSFCR